MVIRRLDYSLYFVRVNFSSHWSTINFRLQPHLVPFTITFSLFSKVRQLINSRYLSLTVSSTWPLQRSFLYVRHFWSLIYCIYYLESFYNICSSLLKINDFILLWYWQFLSFPPTYFKLWMLYGVLLILGLTIRLQSKFPKKTPPLSVLVLHKIHHLTRCYLYSDRWILWIEHLM